MEVEVHSQFQFDQGVIIIANNIRENYIRIDNTDYYLSYLDPRYKGNKGGNSFVFAMYDAQDFGENEGNAVPCKVIKICKFPAKTNNQNKIIPDFRTKRFVQEIQALTDCKQRKTSYVIEIFDNGFLWCTTKKNGKDGKIPFLFYTMEYAKPDLKSFMEENAVEEAVRVLLCLQIAQGLKQLNDLGYYHRDIKPDNIFVVDGTWKIGDLGLVAKRNSPSLDKSQDFIGPRGWISPETMNKYLSEDVPGKNFDCSIDHQSDLFQLAKVFWYILQGNAPIGCIKESDFLLKNSPLYSLIKQMLNHAKSKRPNSIDVVISDLHKIVNKYYK